MVVAETAMVMPALVFIAWLMSWGASIGVMKFRLDDATHIAVRSAAMGASDDEVAARLRRQIPGAATTLQHDNSFVAASSTLRVVGPGVIPDVTLRSRSVALLER